MELQQQNIRHQRLIVGFSVFLFVFKAVAYFITNSVSVLTDTLESTVNILASLIGLYSLNLSAKPADADHPYGHGKIEFVSAGIEGALIAFAGILIIYEGIDNLIHPHQLKDIDFGIGLVLFTAFVNFILGYYTLKKGKQNNSLPLISSGQHLISDTYSTIGIVVGLALVYFTGLSWIDNWVAILFGLIIVITGFRILRKSLAGIMDEADQKLIEEVILFIREHRRPSWIDLHNLRIIKYGSILHIDAHLTLPFFYTVQEAHKEVKIFEESIRSQFGGSVELFIHIDDCKEFSCEICKLASCNFRKRPFEKEILWNLDNILLNFPHSKNS